MVQNDNTQADLSEAQVYEEMGLYSEALAAYEKVLSNQSDADSTLLDEINGHIERLRKKVADDSMDSIDEDAISREAMGEIKTQSISDKDIAPILDRASVFLEKGLHEEAADEYAMLFSMGYSYDSIIPPIIDFLRTFCPYGQLGRELVKVIDKFNLEPNELAEISACFGYEIGKQGQYPAAVGLLEKAKDLDPDSEEIEKMYETIASQFASEPITIYLVRRTRLTEEQLVGALETAFINETSLYYTLVQEEYIDKPRLLKALNDYHKIPTIEFDPDLAPPHRLAAKMEKEVLLCQGWVPMEMGPSIYKVVVENPEDTYQTNQIKRMLGNDDLEYCISIQEDIQLLIDHFFKVSEALDEEGGKSDSENEDDIIVADIIDMFERKNGWNPEKKMPIRPQLLSAEIILDEKSGNNDPLLVRLKDSSEKGFGILVSSEEYSRINKVKVGDMLDDTIFYAAWAILRTKSVVQNVTRINEGKDKGHYFVELKSEDVV